MFTKEQLDERVKPLKDEEAQINARIKALSKSNDDIRHDIAEVDETIAFLMEQDENCNNRMNNSTVYQPPAKEQIIQDIEQIIVEPDGHLTVKLKAYEEIDRLLMKHRQLIEAQGEQRKVS